jgi:hypothetical protein
MVEPFQNRIQLWSVVNMAAKTLSHKVGNVLYTRLMASNEELSCSLRQLFYFQKEGAWIKSTFFIRPVKISSNTVEPAYNDIGLCGTSAIMSDILWYQFIPHYQP